MSAADLVSLFSCPAESKQYAAECITQAREARKFRDKFRGDADGKWIAVWLNRAANARREAMRRNQQAERTPQPPGDAA